MRVDRDAVEVRTPQPRRAGALLAVVCAAQFMAVLDISVVNVALPSVRTALALTDVALSWVVNAYALVFAGLLLLGGRLADLCGRRRILLTGLAVFATASLIGGLAQSGAWLIVARAAQGLGAAVLAPVTLAILTATFDEGRRRTRALAVWTALGLAGGTAGNLLGGVLTEWGTWRSTLLVNVPVGLLAIAAVPRVLEVDRPAHPGRLDIPGAVLATGGLGALAYGIGEAAHRGWTSTPVAVGTTVGVLLLGGFVLVESRNAAAPLMPPRLWRIRSVAVGNVLLFLAGTCLNPMWFFLTLSMQVGLGYGPLRTGLAFLPHTLVAIVIGTWATPWLLHRVPSRVLIASGALVAAAGFLWQAQLDPADTYLTGIFGPAVVFSVGAGLLNTPLTAATMSGVGRSEAGAAAGLMNTTKQVGAGLGLAVLVTAAAPGDLVGYNRAFVVIAVVMVVVAVGAALLPPVRERHSVSP